MNSPCHTRAEAGIRLRLTVALLTLVVVLGCAMRLNDLGQKGMWVDELFTLNIAMRHPLVPADGQPWFKRISVYEIGENDSFLTAKAAEQSPPLQDLLEKASVQWLGPNEFAARLPGALASCLLLVWFAWFALRHSDPGVRRVLRWSLLFLALAPSLVIFAQDGRAYSLGASLLGMAGLLWMLRWRGGLDQWSAPGWGETALFALACYTHYNAAVLVVLFLSADAVAATLKRAWHAWRRLLLVVAVFGLWLFFNGHTIRFTTRGGVSWGERSASHYVMGVLTDASRAFHRPWLWLALFVTGLLVVMHLMKRGAASRAAGASVEEDLRQLAWLVALILVYVALAGTVAAKAGMGHHRYYLFIVPAFCVALGLLFQRLRGMPLQLGAGLAACLLAVPGMRPPDLAPREDFREATQYAVERSDRDTLFLFPWAGNRDIYRFYLDRYLGGDSRARMVAVSVGSEAPHVCERLRSASNVAVIAHDSGRGSINAVYAACGGHWPLRDSHNYHNTFSEHWRQAPKPAQPGSTP